MSLFDFIRLLYRNALLLVTVPMVLAISVFYFTRNEDHEYSSKALIYTGIASGFNIESGDDSKMDYKVVNNAFDNLMLVIESRITLEEVALRLLASHLMVNEPTPGIIAEKAFTTINTIIPPELKKMAVDTSVEYTYQRLDALHKAQNPILVNLVDKGHTHWSISTLGGISAKRISSSDMVELSFTSTDPNICQQTLEILLEVFTRRYKELKQSETGNVVAYFEAELLKVKGKLTDAEDRLTEFRVKSQVINYVEQTKALAFKRQNAVEEFSMKKINLKATEAALKEIEEKLKIRESILGKNLEVLEKKQILTETVHELAMAQNSGKSDTVINELQEKQQRIRDDLQRDVQILYQYSHSKEGLPSSQLLNDWLNNLVQMEREKVVVNLYQVLLDDLMAEYDRFAPMGSTIARLEREIGVYERAHLEILHGLNMAKLKQQNIEMSSSLDILDAPLYPREPLASKRGLLIVASFMFGFFAVVAGLVIGQLLDHSLKNPERAKAVTGLPVAGALPVLTSDFSRKYGNLSDQVNGIIASKVKLEKYAANKNEATLIVGLSTQVREGKTHAFSMIFLEMIRTGESVCLITPKEGDNPPLNQHHFQYELTDNFVSDRHVIQQQALRYKYILLEIPAWVTGKIPVRLIERSQLLLWTIRADKVWSTAHLNMLADLEKITKVTPSLILNGVKPYYLDQLVAEIPVKRSVIAKWVRKIVKFELGKSDLSKVS